MAQSVPVDETDFRILREIFQGDAESFRSDRVTLDAIADRLKLHRNTVSARVKRLTENRVLLPASLEVEPALFSLVGALAFLDLPRDRRADALAEAAFAIDGVQTVFAFLDGLLVILYADAEPALLAKIEQVRRAVGAGSARLDLLTTRDYPPAEPIALAPLDVRLLLALLDDARASFNDVARPLDVSPMTVKRRFERLAREGALYLYPGSGAAIEGMVMGYVTVDVPGGDAHRPGVEKALDDVLPDWWIRNSAGKSRIAMITFARSVDALAKQADVARRVPHVAAVDLHVFTGIHASPRYRAWFADVIRSRAPAGAVAGHPSNA